MIEWYLRWHSATIHLDSKSAIPDNCLGHKRRYQPGGRAAQFYGMPPHRAQ